MSAATIGVIPYFCIVAFIGISYFIVIIILGLGIDGLKRDYIESKDLQKAKRGDMNIIRRMNKVSVSFKEFLDKYPLTPMVEYVYFDDYLLCIRDTVENSDYIIFKTDLDNVEYNFWYEETFGK